MIERRQEKRSSRGRGSTLTFLVIVFVVALGGTFLGFRLFGGGGEGSASDSGVPRVITVEVLITTTPNPSPQVLIITATDLPGRVTVPVDIAPNTTPGSNAGPTIDPSNVGASGAGVDSEASAQLLGGTALPENCIAHELVDGDTPFGVAEQYGANPFLLMEVNGLDDDTASLLQIGDVLIVPLEGCNYNVPPTPTDAPEPTNTLDPSEVTEEPTLEFTPTITPTATITLAPTATNAQIEIVDVEGAGDVTAEGIRLRNNGNTINVTGWTLTDAEGNTFSFPEQLLFSNAEVTIYTRAGTNTPVALFWGLDEAVWTEGDVLTLIDANDDIQASIRLPSDIDLE